MTTISTTPVSPGEIQNELDKIWESLETTNVTRARLFNLIFFTEKNHRTPYIQRLAQRVIEKFPSRVIFVFVDKNAKEDFIKTEVSILSSSKGEFDVACDYIQIEAGRAFCERIPFVVLPHILPDLPVYLLWAEDPSKGDVVNDKLMQFANRMIFDSESTDNLPRFANRVLDQYKKSNSDVADLNWARTESWRDMLSMAFYSEDKLKKIQQTKKINIVYNAQETSFFCHTKIQAIYLQAWLSCQLKWQFQTLQMNKDQACCFVYKGNSGSIEITIEPAQYAKLPPGLILIVDILTIEGEQFKFTRDLERMHEIALEHSTASQCDIPSYYIFSKAEAGHSLVKEIGHRGTSEHYLKVLNLVKEMETLGLC